MVSPAVGENVVGEEEGDKAVEEVMQMVDEGFQVRPKRRLKKASSVPVDETEDSEEIHSDEDVRKLVFDSDVNKEEQTRKRRQKQVARTGPAAKKAKTDKENVSLLEEEIEPIKEPDVSGNPTIAELDQQVDELLVRPFIS
ncbi:hypothetical protein Dimus_013799 [Dionaea muscipula]